ncbi:MAG: type II toxin-antitoxin system death-on-curing family toxin [Planctomycetales bacterium]|nr:type II toxin-antitoxin system death-on-curing family toxin [Planctomycetales bacterium]
MNEPNWITAEAVSQIHERQLTRHGGIAGVRDAGLLQSALHRPRNLWAYEPDRCDVPRLAAAYAIGIARNHPFLDGNKRTAAVVCEVFLLDNGLRLTAADDPWYETAIAVASGGVTDEALSDWLRDHTAPTLIDS